MKPEIFDYIAALSAKDKKTLTEKALKTAEEVGELAKAVLPFDNVPTTTHRFVTSERILEETADVILCALSVAYQLGYSHDDIGSMMMKKAQYWDELQTRERDVTYPLPYEIHVTVSPGEGGLNIEQYKADCAEIGVKPLLIDLHNQHGETVMLDAQTSSVHMGDNRSAFLEVSRIKDDLVERGYNVARQKIETVPWHPAAPSNSHSRQAMPPACYFEAHFNVVVSDDRIEGLRAAAYDLDAHVSRNAFKKISDDTYVMMVTYRKYDGTYERFKGSCENIATQLRGIGFEVPKTITEFSIFDTRISHDAAWLVGLK
jgi:NTP pyrophosphatase (non-canonical NTP hydrolase)